MTFHPCDTLELPTLDGAALNFPGAHTVLIVDDDPLVLSGMHDLVVAAGYRCRTAVSARGALEMLQTDEPSVVLTDVNMPGMNGVELCRCIRARASPHYIYVMLLTVRDDEGDILAGLDAGADDYLSKRMSRAQITARLRTAIRIVALEHSLRTALDQKHQQAMTDSLTGVFNRRYFMQHLGREVKRMRRRGGDLSILLLDIDHFKRVNDSFGHWVGDEVLQGITAHIAQAFQRATDWCARLGGEEFAVVFEGTKPAQAQLCAERLRALIESTPIQTRAGMVRITVSIGLSGIHGAEASGAASVEALLQEADSNLYASKAAGRNRVTGCRKKVLALKSA